MIKTREDLKYYISEDKKRYGNVTRLTRILGGSEQWYIWRVVKSMRVLEYLENNKGNVLLKVMCVFQNIRHHHLMKNTQIYIFPNCFGPGLYIPHLGSIHVSGVAKVGKNCCIRPGVMIASSLSADASKLHYVTIGDNVEFSEGVKVLCKKIGNNVKVGPNVVLLKSVSDNTVVHAPMPKYIQREV